MTLVRIAILFFHLTKHHTIENDSNERLTTVLQRCFSFFVPNCMVLRGDGDVTMG